MDTSNGLMLTPDRAQSIQTLAQSYLPILRELIVNGKKLSEQQIIGRAVFAAKQGLDPITEVNTITDSSGNTMAHSMHVDGYRRKCQEQVGPTASISLEFIELTQEQLIRYSPMFDQTGKTTGTKAHVAFECRLRDDVSYTTWQKRCVEIGKALREATGGSISVKDILELAGPAPVYTGVGIVYKSELNDYKDRNFNPVERAKKRAEVNARKKRFPTNAPIYSDGEVLRDEAFDAVSVTVETPTNGNGNGHKPRRSAEEINAELGFAPEKKPAPVPEPEPVQEAEYTPEPEPSNAYTREDFEREQAEAQAEQQPEQPEPTYGHTPEEIEWAGNITTSRGTKFSTLSDDQLTLICESNSATPDMKKAAGILIDERIANSAQQPSLI